MPLLNPATRLKKGDGIVSCYFPHTNRISSSRDFFLRGDRQLWCVSGDIQLQLGIYHGGKVSQAPYDEYYADYKCTATFDFCGSFPLNFEFVEYIKANGSANIHCWFAPILGSICGPIPETPYAMRRFIKEVIRLYHPRIEAELQDCWYKDYQDWEDGGGVYK